jgi:hypothetical protein
MKTPGISRAPLEAVPVISQKQLDANRRNALKSTGPRTPQGKAAVRLNALKHGLHAQEIVLSPEEQIEFDRALAAFLDDLRPDGPTGTLRVRQIAEATWRIGLLRAYETQLFNESLRKLAPSLKKKYRSLTPQQRLAAVFHVDACGPRRFDRLSRQEAHFERAFHRALEEFQRLQASGPDVPPPSRRSSRAVSAGRIYPVAREKPGVEQPG